MWLCAQGGTARVQTAPTLSRSWSILRLDQDSFAAFDSIPVVDQESGAQLTLASISIFSFLISCFW